MKITSEELKKQIEEEEIEKYEREKYNEEYEYYNPHEDAGDRI